MKALNKTYAFGLCFLASMLPIVAEAAGEGGGSGGLLKILTIFGVIVAVLMLLAAAWYSILWGLQKLKRALGI